MKNVEFFVQRRAFFILLLMIYKRERNLRGVAKFMRVTAKTQLHPFEQQACLRCSLFQ